MKIDKQESVLEDILPSLSFSNNKALHEVHIPMSDVFYVRAAIEADTGVRYTLDHVERSMYLEGHLGRNDVLDPDRPRGYCTYDA